MFAGLSPDAAHLQARPEHSVVLRANTGSSLAGDHNRVSSCTLLLRYIKPHDEFSPPDLTVELDNPQVLLLFRCVSCCPCSLAAKGCVSNEGCNCSHMFCFCIGSASATPAWGMLRCKRRW